MDKFIVTLFLFVVLLFIMFDNNDKNNGLLAC